MLTVKMLKGLKPRRKPFKKYDALGLYVVVETNGSILWRFKYRFDNAEKGLSFGTYPDVRLSAARKKRNAARRLLKEDDIDPGAQRKAEKLARLIANAGTFKAIASEWLAAGCPGSKGPLTTHCGRLPIR